jgi:hypothetical protein
VLRRHRGDFQESRSDRWPCRGRAPPHERPGTESRLTPSLSGRGADLGIGGHPLFLLGALAAAFIEAGTWRVDMAIVWGSVLLGLGIAFIIEWRTVGQDRASKACTSF